MGFGFGGYLIVMIVGALVSGAAALWVRSSYSKYSKQPSASGLTGAQVARTILDRNNLSNVQGRAGGGHANRPLRPALQGGEAL